MKMSLLMAYFDSWLKKGIYVIYDMINFVVT